LGFGTVFRKLISFIGKEVGLVKDTDTGETTAGGISEVETGAVGGVRHTL
jgi:hypothetical protein